MTQPAPVYSDAFTLCAWLHGRLGDDARVLALRICEHALDLLESIALALSRQRCDLHIERADHTLLALRLNIRMAEETGYLSSSQVVHALERADAIGRQLGGWSRSRRNTPHLRPV